MYFCIGLVIACNFSLVDRVGDHVLMRVTSLVALMFGFSFGITVFRGEEVVFVYAPGV